MNARKSSHGKETGTASTKVRASRANSAWKRALSVVMSVLMAVSMSPWAEVPSAYAADGAAQTAQATAAASADTKTVDVSLSLGSGSITVDGQTIKAPSSKIAVPSTKDFTFTASAGSVAALAAVNLTHGQNSTPLSPDGNGVYTVPQDQLVEGVGIELVAEDAANDATQESAPTAFTKKAPAAKSDSSASSSSSAETSSDNATVSANTLAAPAASTGISVSLQFKDANGAPVAAPDLGGQYLYAYVIDNNNAKNHVLLPLVAGANGYAADVTGLRTDWWPETLSDLDPQGSYTVTLCTFGDEKQSGYGSPGTALSNGGLIANSYIVSLPASGTVTPGGSYTATATAFGPAGSDEFTGVLGDAIDYGITTGTFTLEGGDAESNVAARVGTCATQTGNDLSNPTTQTMLIGEIQNKFITKGYSVYFRTSPESADKVVFSGGTNSNHVLDTSSSKDQLQAEVQGMLDSVAAKQKELAAHQANAAVTYRQNDQRYVLDIKGRGAGTYYVTMDNAAFANALSENGKFKIYKDDDQTIVFNVTATGDLNISQFSVNDRAAGNMVQSDAGDTPQQIIWNFTGASSVKTTGSVTGVFLATGADWYNDSTSSGWLVAKSVFIRSGEWHNVYQHNKQYNGGSGYLAATKHINGEAAAVSGFKFKLEEQTPTGWQQVGDLVANDQSTISFGPLAYNDDNFVPDSAGGNVQTHVYRITEDQASSTVGGVSYTTDTTAYYAKIVVHKFVDTLGSTTNTTYVAEPASYYADAACTQALPAGAVFNNTSSSKVSSELKVKKAISGRDWRNGDSFQFTLTAQDGAPLPDGSADGSKTVTATDASAVSFGEIAFDAKDAVYTYTIKEVMPEDAAKVADLAYDTAAHTATVTVKDGAATVAYDGAEADALTITNTKSAKTALQANKTLNGKVPDSTYDGKFSFELKDADGKVLQTKQNSADGTVAFGKIDYTAAGTYAYTINEVVPADADKLSGVTYDTTVVHVTVTVANENGHLVATPAYTYGDGQQGNTFKNTYAAKGSLTLTGTKTLLHKSLTDGAFSFVVTENGSQVATGTSKADGSIAFTPIEYAINANDTSALGEHTYTVSEVMGDKAGVTYDANNKTVKVNVTDKGDGTLDAQVVPGGSDELSFTNAYAAKGSITLTGTKSLTGRDAKAGEFGFTVKDEAGNVVATGSNGANGAIAFTPITYTQADAGDHTYTVTENQGNLGGVAYDQSVKTVVVHVADNGDGTLTAAVVAEQSQALAFTNTYTATGEAQFTAHKNLTGRDLANGEFSFQLKDAAGNVLQTKTNDADGNVTFDKIAYGLADVGTHTYTISEVKGTEGGVTYDAAIKTVTVDVTDNGNGTLAVTTQGDGDAATFTNAYAAAGDFTLQGAKHLDGRTFQKGDSWTFTVSGSEGAPLPATTQVTIDPTTGTDAAFSFGNIHYTLDDAGKTYVYTIAESGTVDGVTNDGGLHEVDVTVADKGDGTLSVTPVYKQDNGTVSGITFTNTYTAKATGFAVSGAKTLEGRSIADGEFQVALYAADDAFAVTDDNPVATASVAADGTYSLSTPDDLIGEAGTYRYVLKEVDTNRPGVTYDTTAYPVTVTATDNGHGQIEATVAGLPDGGANFTNTFTKGTAVFKAHKTLEGAALSAGEFSFELLDSDGKMLQTVTNAADGSVSFAPISFSEPGDYHYTIREVAGSNAGMTYDKTTHPVTAHVAAGENGTFNVTYSYDMVTTFLPAAQAPVPEFHNSYRAAGSTTVSGHKTVNGQSRHDLDGKVSFELSGSDGAPLPASTTAYTDADGNFSFGDIAYTEADAGKTYTYTVSEVSAPSGYTLAAPQTFEVSVSDNGDGTLTVASTAGGSGLAFDDTYAASGSAHFAAAKQLEGADLAAGAFSFTLSKDGTVLQTKQNAADGSISFDDISYTIEDLKNADGTYAQSKDFQYQIAEAVPEGATQNPDGTYTFAGVTYDGSAQNVTVHVANNGDGTLAVTYDGDANTNKVFTNSYHATGEAALSATKVLEGAKLQADEFSFELKDASGNVLQTVSNDANGLAAFAPISYDTAGTYHYTISEVAGFEPDMTYDASVKDVQVNVADKGDGTMKVTYGADGAATFASPVFGNTHNAKGQAQITVKKQLEGKALAADDFSFQLKDEAGNLLQTASNAADGTVAFAPISYELADLGGTDAKDFHYTVAEVPGSAQGITYDSSVKDVTVHVALDKASGTLATSVTFAGGDDTFTNTYEAEGVAHLTAHKQLDGKALEAGAFSFQLKDEAGTVLQTKQNDANGTVTFDPIAYNQDVLKNADGTYKDHATYTYTVSEQIP